MNISITTDINTIKKNVTIDSINLMFTGDFCPDRQIAELINTKNYDRIFNDFTQFSREADLSITNLECPLTNKNNPIKKVGPLLKGPPEAVNALEYAGFNIACLANNHIMDHGPYGLQDTMDNLMQNNIQYVGAGRNIREACNPLFVRIKGCRLAIINITEYEFSIASKEKYGAAPVDEIINYYQIINAKKKADFLLIIIHGGHEMYSLPSPNMKNLYRYYIDLGADAVIGHHPHVFSGYEIYQNCPIFYSLGNFIFDRKNVNSSWHYGFAVILSIDKKRITSINLIPYSHSLNDPGVYLLKKEEIQAFYQEISEYNNWISDPEKIDQKFEHLVNEKRAYYLSIILGLNRIQKKLLKNNLYPKFALNKKRLINDLDLFRCQSHREAVIEVLKGDTNVF